MKHKLTDQLSVELKSLLKGYPSFVYSKDKRAKLDGIPVFVYHTIDPNVFESHLSYLQQNNYKTLSIEEFYDAVTNKVSLNNNSVLLTIDDARTSVWRFAYPLLKKYQMRATVFIIPGLTEESKNVRKNLELYWRGKISYDEIIKIDMNDDLLCNWAEIEEMYNSGIINIESHTLFHKEVFISKKVISFITSQTPKTLYNFAGSGYFNKERLKSGIIFSDFYGLPVFESAPLMFVTPRIEISMDFINKCREIYSSSNNPNSNQWKEEIIRMLDSNEDSSYYFTQINNTENEVLDDLVTAKEMIQSRLNKNAGNHLCLPWTIGNEKTVELCKKAKIKSCFWGVLENKKINKPGDDPIHITRLKNDFVLRLPGNGRKRLLAIYTEKIKRRTSGEKYF